MSCTTQRLVGMVPFTLMLSLSRCLPFCAQEASRPITDSAGRRVEIPRQISRVLAAGPPASILIYTLTPEKRIG
jgi:iron complex transport system substrate-binding protein